MMLTILLCLLLLLLVNCYEIADSLWLYVNYSIAADDKYDKEVSVLNDLSDF